MPTRSAIHHVNQLSLNAVPNAMFTVNAPMMAPQGALISPQTATSPMVFFRRPNMKGGGNSHRRSDAPITAATVLASQKLKPTQRIGPGTRSDRRQAMNAQPTSSGHVTGAVTTRASRYRPLGGHTVAKLPGLTESAWPTAAAAK